MTDYQAEMNTLVSGLVDGLNNLFQRAVADALGAVIRPASRTAVTQASDGLVASHIETTGRSNRKRSSKAGFGEKRPVADLEKLAERFVTFVTENPGLRIEVINKKLGTTTKELALPIRKLIANGNINPNGEKRSRTYFPGKKGKA